MKELYYKLSKIVNIKTNFTLLIGIISLVCMVLFISYAIFTIDVEKTGALNIMTANLYYNIEGEGLSESNTVVVPPKATKGMTLKITNLNSIKTTYSLWYKSSIKDNVKVLYDPSNDPSKGNLIDAYTTTSNSKTIRINISNENTTEVVVELGVRGGLFEKPLALENTELVINEGAKLSNALLDNLGNTGTVYTASTGVKYIRGESNVVNNYLWYSGMMWRIFAVNPDGSVKAVTDDNVSAFSFGSNNTYEGSYIQNWLNTYFWERLNASKTSVLKQNNEFCNDAVSPADKDSSVRETCTKKILNQKVGLLSLDEYNIVKNGSNSNYLNNRNNYWTSSPDGGSAGSEWYVSGVGIVSNIGVNYAYAVRAITVFVPALVISKGNGTQLTPYKLTTDTAPAVAGTKLNLRHSGEFINYDNKLWRIMEVAGGMTKVVYDGSPVLGGEAAFGAHNLGWNITKTRLDGIGISTTKIALNQTWERGYYNYGEDVMTTSLASGNPETSTIGLARVGEMWATQNNNITNNYSKHGGQDYWTMTPDNASLSCEWMVYSTGFVDTDGVDIAYGVRPVFFFKEDTTISGGNGTPDSPYIL